MRRSLYLVVIASLLLELLAPALQPSVAYAAGDDGANAIAGRLGGLAHKLDELAYVEALGDLLPLTATSVSDDLGLALSHLFGDTLGIIDSSPGSLSALEAAILTASGNVAGTEIAFSDVVSSTAGSVTHLSFSVNAAHVDSLIPVAYYTDTVPLDLYGGGITTTFELSTAFSFAYDASETYAPVRMALDVMPTIEIAVSASGPIAAFESLFGFTEIEVGGEVTLSEQIAIDFRDPDDDGRITEEEWTHTAVLDLTDIAYDEGNLVDAALALEALPVAEGAAPLIPEASGPDGTLTLFDDAWGDGIDPPTPAPGYLAPFANIKADDVLAGLAQFAVAIMTAQAAADEGLPEGQLPFLEERLSDAFAVVDPLEDFLGDQGDAYVFCGTTDANPPAGDVSRLEVGDTVYCQAVTLAAAGVVEWSAENAALAANGTVTETVGRNPSANAVFTMTEAAEPRVRVDFQFTDDDEWHSVTRRFRSLQALYAKLGEFGLISATSDVSYALSSYALAYDLHAVRDAQPVDANLNYGDQLKPATGLYGLGPTDAADAKVDAGEVSMDVTFGVILVDDAADITPDDNGTDTIGLEPGLADRFFLGVHGGPEFEVNQIAFTTTVDLEGMLGYVEVTAVESASQIASTGMPAVSVEIGAPGVPISGALTIGDAILLRDLMSDTARLITPTIQLSMTAELLVQAAIDDGAGGTTSLGQGTVRIDWPDAADRSSLQITVSPQFADELSVYDIAPSLFGTATLPLPASPDPPTVTLAITDTLHDPGASFPEDVVGRELRNLSDGSRCLIAARIDGQTVQCADGLSGGADNAWDVGDTYEVVGDPTALRDVILDSLSGLAYRMGAVTPTQVISGELYFGSLPLIGVSPYDLATQFDAVQAGIEAVRAGVPDAVIQCGVTNTLELTGSLSLLTVDTLDPTDTFYCQATTPSDAPVDDVEWSVTGAGNVFTGTAQPEGLSGPDVLTATVGLTPTTRAVFHVETEPAGVQVSVVYTDARGRHTASYPPSPLPASLQQMEGAIESKLGLSTGGLVIETRTLTNPHRSEAGRHLVAYLAQGVCTKGHPECAPGDQQIPAPGVEFQIAISDTMPTLVATERTDTAQLEYASRARLDMAFPLSHTVPITEVGVLESTGLTMTLSVSSTALGFPANLGPLTLDVGIGSLVEGRHQPYPVTGSYSATITSTDTMTDPEQLFLMDWGVVLSDTAWITNTQPGKDNAYCEVDAVSDTVVTCKGVLSGEEYWATGDSYALTASSSLVLHDPGADFSDEVVGQIFYNQERGGASCTIGERLDADTLRCTSALEKDGQLRRWKAGDEYSNGALGEISFGARFSLQVDGYDPDDATIETYTLEGFVTSLRAAIDRPGGSNPDVHARLSLRDVNTTTSAYLGVLDVYIADVTDLGTMVASIPPAVEGRIASASLDFEHLMLPLDALRGSLAMALDGNESGFILPMVGARLDAGAEVAKRLWEAVVDPLGDPATGLAAAIDALPIGSTMAPTVALEIQTFISTTLAGTGMLIERPGDDVAVELDCGGPCDDSHHMWDIDEVRLSFTVGEAAAFDVPFDSGLANVALYSDQAVQAHVTWTLSITLGINRELGAYLEVGPSDAPADLALEAAVGFKAGGNCTNAAPNDFGGLSGFSNRCFVGQIGILPVVYRDGGTLGGTDNATSTLDLALGLYLISASGATDGVIAYAELADDLTAVLSLDAKANIDLSFRSTFGFGGLESEGFPNVVGTFHMRWDPDAPGPYGDPVSELRFANLYIDPGSFLNGFLGPVVEGVQRVTKPLQSPIDVLMTPLPVLSDIARLGGGGPIRLFDLMKAISGNNLTLIEYLIGFVQFVNALPVSPESGVLLALGEGADQAGEFSLDVLIANTTGAQVGDPTPRRQACYQKIPSGSVSTAYCAYKTYQEYKKVKQALQKEEQAMDQQRQRELEEKAKQEKDDQRKQTARSKRETDASKKVSKTQAIKAGLKKNAQMAKKISGGFEQPPSVSFPFLEDSRQVFYALLGQDVTLIRVDLGTVAATAGVYFRFRIQAGPVPISIIIGGQATIRGRFAMGYDTRGFAPLLSGRAGWESLTASSLLDGIYLDDFDAAGTDVPEIKLTIEVSIAGAVDLGIISAGIEAGIAVVFALDFDNRLHDPPGSGKLRIKTIANIENPFCLFVFRGKGELFFRVFIEINLFLFKKRFSWEPFAREQLFTFEIKCEPPKPVLASQVGTTLTLNMGSTARRKARAVFKDEVKERFIVRQLTTVAVSGLAKVSVTAFNYTQEFENVGQIMAYAGSGDDHISLQAGQDITGNAVAFTLDATIDGGEGNDVIRTGEGDDHVYGGEGADTIATAEGSDWIEGGGGNDGLDGGEDNDVILGQAGDDTIGGGPGSDYMDGGPGRDVIDGGPGTEPGGELAGPNDLWDIAIGGEGDDTLRGHFGDDLLFGNAVATPADCPAPPASEVSWACYTGMQAISVTTGSGDNTLLGAEGDDLLVGGNGQDLIEGDAGNDTVYGNDGNDTILGHEGIDTVYAGAGDDEVYGHAGNDTLHGGVGRDDLLGGAGTDHLYGGAGNDFLVGDEGQLLDHEIAAHDVFSYTAAMRLALFRAPSVDTGVYDVIYGGSDSDLMFGEAGADQMYGDGGDEAVTDGSDYMEGGSGSDYMEGDGGDDTIYGGGEADEMYGGTGNDVMYGDSGNDYMEGNEGADTMRGGIGEDDVLGGGLPQWTSDDAGDEIYGDEGDDVILGDIGVVPVDTIALPDYSRRHALDLSGYYSGTLAVIQTISPTVGLTDTIRGHVGTDILLGGAAGDEIYGNTDTDYVLGDGGRVYRDAEGVVHRVESADPCTGGEDTIYGNEAPDVLIGGDANDEIHGDEGDDTILGDNGTVILTGDQPDVYSTDPECGGSDTIEGNDGADIVLGGSGGSDLVTDSTHPGDTIGGQEGTDILLGDNGHVYRDRSHVVLRIASTYPATGGDDAVAGHEGTDVIVGGMDGDALSGGEGDDILLGDNGVIVRADGSEQEYDVYSSDPEHGGSDTIEGNEGDDIVLGGSGGTDLSNGTLLAGDVISGNLGADILLGDNGYITRTEANGQPVVLGIDSTEPGMGAGDTIYGHEGDDVILGVSDADAVYGHEDNDILLGDSGRLDYGEGGSPLLLVTTTDPTVGGADTIDCGPGIDMAFGGTDGDEIDGGDNHDILLGDHGFYDVARPVDQPVLAIDTGMLDGGGIDTIHGGEGDDFIMGQQMGDWLYGDLGDDDVTGGHNVPAGADGDDSMYGKSDTSDGTVDGGGADVMLGDNGVITRTLTTTDTWKYEAWITNTFNLAVSRVVELYDVELYDVELGVGLAVDPSTYGDDDMWGNDNDDRMWGQGGEDEMVGGAGDDYMEGNAASDWMEGGSEQDDMLGGTGPILSSDPSTAYHHATDTSTLTRTTTVSNTAEVEVSLGDTMFGDADADVMLGDNGIITRTLTTEGEWLTWVYSMSLDSFGAQLPRHPTGGAGSRVDRVVSMVEEAAGLTAGNDWMFGGSGDDDMYGQFDDSSGALPVGDEMWGDEGEDAMLGDQGVVQSRVLVDPTQFIAPRQPFIDDQIYISGTLFREVALLQWATGGNDRMRGGDDGDWMHGGAGDDLMNGNAGNDRMFGDDGADAMWGGPHHDHLWGGYGMDSLDVRPRTGLDGWNDDPLEWQELVGEDHYQDIDYVYGGWDQDAMQANIGDEGPVPGDRLIDWVGAYNAYYLCPGLYGEFVATRSLNPSMIKFLQMLSEGDGAFTVTDSGASGWDELAMVYNTDTKDNAHPPHPDTPGHFVCDVVSPTVRVLGIDLPWSVKKEVYTVNGAVTVIDQLGALARRATVTVTWWITPTDGSELLVEEQAAETNSKGVASFTAPGNVAGTYTLVVEGVSLEGYTYDEENSVTRRSVSVPGKMGTGYPYEVYLPLLIR